MLAYTLVSLNVWYYAYWFRNSLETKLHPKIYTKGTTYGKQRSHHALRIPNFHKKIYIPKSKAIIVYCFWNPFTMTQSLQSYSFRSYYLPLLHCITLSVWEFVRACNLVQCTLQKCYTSAWKFPHFASAQNVMSILYKCLTKLSFSRWYAVEHFHNKIPNNACISHTFEL